MHFEFSSDDDFCNFIRFPRGYPRGHPVDGSVQMPRINRVQMDIVLDQLVAFDDRGRASDPSKSGIHFYRHDRKFEPFVRNPLRWVEKLMNYAVVLTPDISITDDMPDWMRLERTCHSRAAGVVLQSRGIVVVPSLRWRSIDDLSFVTAGIEQNSTIAMSNYGARRSVQEKMLFRVGAERALQILKPRTLLLFGSLDIELEEVFAKVPELHVYESPTVKEGQGANHAAALSSVLF
jgi:hypothetical protein